MLQCGPNIITFISLICLHILAAVGRLYKCLQFCILSKKLIDEKLLLEKLSTKSAFSITIPPAQQTAFQVISELSSILLFWSLPVLHNHIF